MQEIKLDALELKFANSQKQTIKLTPGDNPSIGKDILELLTTGMYVDPLVVYREYIQNAVDAIDDAVDENILPSHLSNLINIKMDHTNRNIRISDNGKGISNKDFIKVMLAIGNSDKRETSARGMRGVGRLSGLGYCQSLIFRSCSKNDKYIYEAVWDCKKIRFLLNQSNQLNLSSLLKKVVSFTKYKKKLEAPHFFEVEMIKPLRLKWDLLMNEKKVHSYLSQVAPVPFSDNFSFKENIEQFIQTTYKDYKDYKIIISVNKKVVNQEDQIVTKQIFKPYQNTFNLNKELQDSIKDIEYIKIPGTDGGLAAIGWLVHSSYLGSIPKKELIHGLRARTGNIMIGDEGFFTSQYTESRFSSWTIGEIHTIENKITPNGRRDGFEENIHSQNLKNQIANIASDISNRCRINSIFRNKLKNIGFALDKAEELLKLVKAGYLSKENNEKSLIEAKIQLSTAEKILTNTNNQMENPIITEDFIRQYDKECNNYEKVIRLFKEVELSTGESLEIKGVSNQKINAYKEIFDLILECSNDRRSSKLLIERIVKHLQTKSIKK